jgi:hypothetical protein
MKKILGVTITIDVKVEGAVPPRAHRSQDASRLEPLLTIAKVTIMLVGLAHLPA